MNVDTHVLVYAFSAGDPRSDMAELLVAQGGVIGVQVLNEFTHVARKKLQWPWTQLDRALSVVDDLSGPPRPLTAAIPARTIEQARSHALPFHDALIVAAAEDAGCRCLLSEDFQHGRRIGQLSIEDPFRGLSMR